MAHTWALSVSHDNMDKEIWLKRMAESDVRNYEYSCGPVPAAADLKKKYECLKPLLGREVRFPSVHLPFWWGAERPAQPEEFERDVCARRLAFLIERFLPLGMKNLTMHPGSKLEGQERADGIENVRKTVRSMIPTVEKYGLSLNLEVCPRGSLGGVPEEMEALLDGMPDCVGICFDVNHADKRYKEVPQWIARLKNRIRAFHISDSDGEDECHWFPGLGALDWPAVMKEINAIDHDCVLIYEVTADGLKQPAFLNREFDPRFYLRQVARNMKWLQSL